MISSKSELKDYLKADYNLYIKTKKHYLHLLICSDYDLFIWRFLKALRKQEYHLNCKHRLLQVLWEKKKNSIGQKLGIFIQPNCVGKALRIWHHGNIVIHKDARLGDYCVLHGMNCIGNKGTYKSGAPTIGNNVSFGVGAVIVGDVKIADNTFVGANSVVTKSFIDEGLVLCGIPAKIKEKDN